MNRSLLPVLILGGLLVLLILILSVFGVPGSQTIDPGRDRSDEGHWALMQLIRRSGYKVSPLRRNTKLDQDHIYLVYGSSFRENSALFSKLFEGEGPHRKILVIGYPDSYKAILHFHLEEREDAARLIYRKRRPPLKGVYEKRSMTTVERNKNRISNESQWEPLVEMGEGTAAFRWKDDYREVLVLTDSRLVENQTLLEGDTALILMELLSPWEGLPLFYGTLPERLSYQGMGFFLKGLPGVIFFHLLALLLFAAWNRAVRMGSPDRVNMDIRREMAEHCAAVGEFYHRSSRWEVFDRIERDYWFRCLEALFPREPIRQDQKRMTLLGRFADPEAIQRAEGEILSAESYQSIVLERDRLIDTIKRIKGRKYGSRTG